MGKIVQNKQLKFEKIINSALNLFMTKGIQDTSISDITTLAGVAKGTFYLYFQDKYSLRDFLIARCARKLFHSAHEALMKEPEGGSFEDKIIFIHNHIIYELEKNRPLLAFISKNLSWGLIQHLVTEDIREDNLTGQEMFEKLAEENQITLKDPDIMIFLIVEMANSAVYSAILGKDSIPLERLMPYLDESIRAIIRNHIV